MLLDYKYRSTTMNNFWNNLANGFNQYLAKPFIRYLSTPVGKITALNTILFACWNAKGLTDSFLVQNFAFDRNNFKNHRFYTGITYAFSHMSLLHFGINMLALQFIGNRIDQKYGPRYVWLLYLAGAAAGSIAMNYFMPYYIVPIPKVGADPGISAFIGFLAALNPKATIFNFIVPIKFWFVLLCAVGFVIVSDSTCSNLGGLAMGVGMGLARRAFLV